MKKTDNFRGFYGLMFFRISLKLYATCASHFGVTCSPFLLNEAIRKHSKTYEFDIDFVNKILDCFYVDDFTGGESDFYKALGLLKKLKLRFLDGHFHLSKWRTKDPKLRKIISENNSNSLKPEKILGIL